MKLTLETNGKVYSVETKYDDVSLEEYFDMFECLLVSATFSEDSAISAIINQIVERLKEE